MMRAGFLPVYHVGPAFCAFKGYKGKSTALTVSRSCIIAAAFIATPAFAEQHQWGQSSVEYSGGVVTFRNELTTGQRDFNVLLTDAGVTVLAIVMQEAGDAPDTLIVQPPPGWLAIPSEVIVEEGSVGVILITPDGLS